MNTAIDNKSRILWVDGSKGIVICLMVLGHSSIPELFSGWIWSFHMPFFFIISALFTSWNKSNWRRFIGTKAKVLLIPFIIYSAINLLLFPIANGKTIIGYAEYVFFNGWESVALWFVPVFFLSIVITRIVPEKLLIPVGICMAALGSWLCYLEILLPWTLSSVPFASALMMLTRKWRLNIRSFFCNNGKAVLMCLWICGAILAFVVSLFWRLDMAFNSINPVIPISIGVCSGTASIIALSVLISKHIRFISNLFTHIGHNTYEIMAMSQIIIVLINHYFTISPIFKYTILVAALTCLVYLRKLIEGRFAKLEAI